MQTGRALSLERKGMFQTWWCTLANHVCLPQACVPVAGQVTPNHVAFGHQGDEDGDRDNWHKDSHKELPVVRLRFVSRVWRSFCKREKKNDLDPSLFQTGALSVHLKAQSLVTPHSNQKDWTLLTSNKVLGQLFFFYWKWLIDLFFLRINILYCYSSAF